MVYQDKVYGEAEISEPPILELIKSPALQRLKGIDNAGYSDACGFNGTGFSRFEHSVGVYILLNKYKASLEEQIAGLIHDVSHTVFSHCVDYALNPEAGKDQLFQDSVFDGFVRRSEIPEILGKHGIETEYILDEKNFLLNERSLPDLCADRIDYSLRTAVAFKDVTQQDVEYFLENLMAENNLWVFANFESAKKFAGMFLKMNRDYYSGLPSAVMLRTTGECLKYALSKKYITNEDLYTVDKKVLEKIQAKTTGDSNLKLLFDRMNNRFLCEENKEDYDLHVFCKSRVVDPFFKQNNGIKRVSEVDEKWKEITKKESVPKEYFIKFHPHTKRV
jgi:hypothetical protein